MAIKNTNNVSLGNGLLFFATTEAELPTYEEVLSAYKSGGLPAMETFTGAMKGNAEITITRESLPFEQGVPQETFINVCIREKVEFKCDLAERTLADIKKIIGGGIYTSTSSGTVATNVDVTLTGTTKVYLGHTPLVSPAPVVTSLDATPVTYTTGDYTISSDSVGSYIIRTSSSTIPSGDTINVAYSFTSSGTETLEVGGLSAMDTFAAMFCHIRRDGKLEAFVLGKASPLGNLAVLYQEADYNLYTASFMGLADSTKPLGTHLFKLYREKAS